MTKAQSNNSQIQKETLAIIFSLNKFYKFLFGRPFILVTNHKPLLLLFGPHKETPSLAANQIAWLACYQLSQFDYKIEYRPMKDHANADALSGLPTEEDSQFDVEETDEDSDMVK